MSPEILNKPTNNSYSKSRDEVSIWICTLGQRYLCLKKCKITWTSSSPVQWLWLEGQELGAKFRLEGDQVAAVKEARPILPVELPTPDATRAQECVVAGAAPHSRQDRFEVIFFYTQKFSELITSQEVVPCA